MIRLSGLARHRETGPGLSAAQDQRGLTHVKPCALLVLEVVGMSNETKDWAAVAESWRGGYSQEQLAAAHTLVENKENWKLPMSTVVTAEQLAAVGGADAVDRAVSYFSGSPCEVFPVAGWNKDGSPDESKGWKVEAPGYYTCVGA